jgi:ABC-2 type transport system ATP-binding protein
VRELGKEYSVILSTHILTEVQTVCSHVQIINKGELVLNVSSDDLAQRMQSSVLTLQFRNTPDLAAIASVTGVKNVETVEGGGLRVYHEPATDPTDALVKCSVERNWGLAALIPQRASLEDIFLELTKGDATHDVAAAPHATGSAGMIFTIARHELRRCFCRRLPGSSWRWWNSFWPGCSCNTLRASSRSSHSYWA